MGIERFLNQPNIFEQPAPGQARAQGETLFEAATGGAKEREERERDFKDQFGINASPRAIRGLIDAWDDGSIDEDGVHSIITARAISDNLARQGIDIPMDQVLGNLDAYRDAIAGPRSGKSYTPKDWTRAVIDSFGVAWHSARRSSLGLERMAAEMEGREDRLAHITERLRIADQQIRDHSDPERRNPVVRALEWAAQSSVYTAGIGIAGMASPALGFLVGTHMMSGSVYNDLRDSGVEVANAVPIALGVGALESAIESQLGVVGGLVSRTGGRTLQGAISKRLTQALISKLGAKGVWLQAATGVVARYTSDALGEGIEEMLQELAEIGGLELANIIQREGITLTDGDRQGYARRVMDAGVAGFAAALVMGFTGVGIDAFNTTADMIKAKNLADATPSIEAFKRDSKELFNEKLSDEEIAAQQKIIHEGRRNIIEQEEAKIAAGARETAGLGEGYEQAKADKDTGEDIPLGGVYHNKAGRLHTEMDAEHGVYKGGDARVQGETNLQEHIKFHVEDGKIYIDEYHVRPDLESPELRREFWRDFQEAAMDHYPGAETVWDPSTEAGMRIREDLVKNNPRGEQAGLNYYAEEDTGDMVGARFRNQVIGNFKKYFPHLGNAEHTLMAAELEHFAGMKGLSLEEHVRREFGGLEKMFTTDPNTDIKAASMEGEKVKGAVWFDGLARDAKAIIYVTENSDLSTFIHEMGHIYRRRLRGELLKEAERLWGVRGGKWTTAQEEQFTEDLERWRRDGTAPTPEMQSFFRKFAEFLKKIANAIRDRAQVSPEIRAFFDRLYAGEFDGVAGDAAQDAPGAARVAQERQARDTTGMGATGHYEANKTYNDERPALDKNNNGKTDPKPQQSGVSNAQELRDKAKKHIEELRSWSNGIVGELESHGIEARIQERPTDNDNPLPIKKLEGIQRKLDDGDAVTDILDVLGITIVVKNIRELVKTTELLSGRDDVVRIKDRYKETENSGYRDILTNVQLSDGMIAEVQVNVEQMLAAKHGPAGHGIYEIVRELKVEFKENRETEKQYKADKDFLNEMSKAVYDDAYEAVLGESHFSADSRDIDWASEKARKQSNRDLVSVLSSFTLNKLTEFGLSANNSSEYISPSMSKNLSEGSSNEGTSEPETSDITVPSTTSIAENENSVNNNQEKNSPENEKRIAKARAKWEAADRTIGAEDQVTLQTGDEINGHYELGEAGISTPSVDPGADFTQSEGFPVNENGTSMNVGRDYTGGFSREAAVRMAAEFDQRGMGIIVDSNGVTSSGNNRDISRRIAAKNGTDGKYIRYLQSRPERWGFTQADLAKYQRPTLYFVVDAPAVYSPLYFDQFNRSGKKSVSPVETAIKMSYLVEDDMVGEFSTVMGSYESISDLYEDTQAATGIFQSLMRRGIVTKNSYPDYVESMEIKGRRVERVTSGGRDFLESVMLGAVLEEDTIRSLVMVPDIRRRVVKGLAATVDNAALGEYGVMPEINQAIEIAVEVQTNKKKYKGIADYANQSELDLGQKVSTDVEVELAGRLLEKTEWGFADMMGGLNMILQEEARGQSDMFGETSKDELLRRYLNVKARKDGILAANSKIIESETARTLEKVEAALENAGLARGEANGTLYQAVYHGSPYRFDRFDSAHMGTGEGAQAYGWGHYFASKKEVAEWYHEELSGKNGVELSELTEPEQENLLLLAKETGLDKYILSDTDAQELDIETLQDYADSTGDGLFNVLAGWVGSADKAQKLAVKYNLQSILSGQLYEVDIPGDEEMLDWDKKLGEQPEKVKEAIGKLLTWRTDQYENISRILSHDIYTIQRLADGYGFQNKIIEGRWGTLAEAQNAGTEHLKNKYKGSLFYSIVSADRGSDKAASEHLNSLGIKGIRYLDGSSRNAGEGSHNYVIFNDGDIAITRTFFQTEGRAYDPLGETQFKERADINTDNFKNWFEDSKVVDENGKPQVVFHGTARPDRIGKKFDPKRATSGPMAFFTTGREVAESYAKSKPDTSLAYDDLDVYSYENWFMVKTGRGKPVPLQDAWYRLPWEQQEKIKRLAPRVTMEEEKIYLADEGHATGIGNYAYEIKERRGNAASTLIEGWLNSGTLFNDEARFMEVLKLAGFDTDSISYHNPHAANPAVFPVYLKIGNPLDTSDINGDTLAALKEASKRARQKRTEDADGWDKNSVPPKKWMERLEKDIRENTAFTWTSIPDWVTKTLKALGYDGIKDRGGKYSGYDHLVWIPFSSTQIKSIYNRGTFNPHNTNILFQLDDRLAEDAAQHESWRGFRDSVETGEPSEADNAWYRSLWNDARKIYNTTLFQDEEKTTRAEELDRRFAAEADRKYLTEALKAIHGIVQDRSLEPAEGEDRTGYDRARRLRDRILHEMPNAGSITGIAAQVNSGRNLSSTQYDRLKKMIRGRTREFRSVLADVMGQEEYIEELADQKDGEPHARLADPRTVREDTMGRLREIGREIGDPALQAAIEGGEIALDDPRIAAYEKGVQSEYKKADTAIKAMEKEAGEDLARLANDAQRRMVKLYEDMLAAKERLSGENDRLNRMVADGIKIAEPYLRQQRLERAGFERAQKAFNDFAALHGIGADVKESLARREARASERATQTGIRRRQRALRALREVKQKLIRRITRNISFENISYDQAIVVKTVQRVFEPSIIEGADKWIGGREGPLLREVWSQWSTDEQYREQLMKDAGEKKAGKIAAILGKPWDYVTNADKRALVKLLPRADFVRDLGLEELALENEESVQLDIDERVINGRVYHALGAELERKVKDALGEDLYGRIQNKPLGEWSIVEAEELARAVDRLTVEGRRELGARKEARRVIEQRYRDQVLAAINRTGITIDDGDTPEEKERKQREIDRILGKYASGKKRNNFFNNFFDANLRRFTTAMDGGRKGIFTSLLYWGENDAYNTEQRQIAARRLAIDTAMKENHVTLDELYRAVELPGLEGTDLYRVSGGRITVDDLLYIMRGYENEETRKAISYGNLSNASERAYYQNRSGNPEEMAAFANVGHGRMMLVMGFAKDFFAKDENRKFLKLAEVIGADYDRNGERLNRAMIGMFNRPMWRVDHYVPMNRREQSGGENENRVLEDLLGVSGAGQRWVGKGFTVKREYISPHEQTPIELGLYKTWAQSVTDTEHLLAYGPLVRTLNAVFKGRGTGAVRQSLRDRWGAAADRRIGDTIAEFANPNPTRQRGELDNLVRSLRGKTATAYLAWKVSAVLKQAVTSPWPYLQEIPPPHYLKACLETAGGFGRANEFIREKSAYMKNREFDPMLKLIKEQMAKNENGALHAIDKFNTLGMQGLEWIDWAAVAPGWLAKYRMELANIAREQEAQYEDLLHKYHGTEWSDVLPTEESKVNRALSEVMSEEQRDYEAVARADDAVRRMQPSSRTTDLAPMFKNRNEVVAAVLQFQVALNVIWQNIRYDLPLAVKEKQVWTVVGMVTGYAMAGIGLGLLLDDGDEKEKQDRNRAAWLLFNSLTQFTDAVPVIGSPVTAMAERVITGKGSYQGGEDLWPVISKAFAGFGSVTDALREDDPEKRKKKFARAAGNMADALGIAFGVPVSGAKELGHAAGIGEKESEFYPEALTGRRKK